MIILAEDSLGWQNRLTDKASVQFRLTAEEASYDMMLLFFINMGTTKRFHSVTMM